MYPTHSSITSSTLVGSIIASIIATNIVTVIIMSSVLLYCWKGRKKDERIIDSFVPITDNSAYGTSLY